MFKRGLQRDHGDVDHPQGPAEGPRQRKDLAAIHEITFHRLMAGGQRELLPHAPPEVFLPERRVGLDDGMELVGQCYFCSEDGDLVSCGYCTKHACQLCLRQCEDCQEIFCSVCSIIDYAFRYERVFCHSCYEKTRKPPASSALAAAWK